MPRSARTLPSGRIAAALTLAGLLSCGGAVAASQSGGSPYASTPTSTGLIDEAAIPLGDGYVSTTPKVGYVDSCQTSFSATGGAQADGPWIDTQAHTWDDQTKLAVNGKIAWSQSTYTVTASGAHRVIAFNDLPTDHTTGVFPIASSDPAHQYDGNPNHIAAQSFSWSLALNPTAANTPSCLSGGPIGVLDDGVALYDALDGEGRDAGAHEVLDACGGHPDQSDTYHHHDVPACIVNTVKAGQSKLVGYALDGYGIYVVKNKQGQLPTNTALDACHGTTSKVLWNGKLTRIYHYVATLEYPYTVGCYHGTPIANGHGGGGAGGAGGAGGLPGSGGSAGGATGRGGIQGGFPPPPPPAA